MDPNWFFSSLAQSAAAIVGIISAILLSKLQDLRKNANDNHINLNNVIKDWTESKDEILKAFYEYQSDEPHTRPPMPWDNIKNFSLDVNILALLHNNEETIKFNKMMQKYMEENDRLHFCEKDNTGEHFPFYYYPHTDDEIIIKKIIIWQRETNSLIEDIKRHNKMLIPKIYEYTSFILFLLFSSCVIVPLCALNSYPSINITTITDKTLLLTVFSISYLALIIILNKEMQDIYNDYTF
jgi:hypothetical protein